MRFCITIKQQNSRGRSELLQAPRLLQQEQTRQSHALRGSLSYIGRGLFLICIHGCIAFFVRFVRQVKTSLEEGAERSMVACDEQLRSAMEWAEGEGLDLNVFLDVVRVGWWWTRDRRQRGSGC